MDDDVRQGRIEAAYAALSRGEFPSLLELFHPDVDFRVDGPAEVPFVGHYRGREGIAAFFQIVERTTERLDPEQTPMVEQIVAIGDQVFAFGRDRVRARATGAVYDGWWVHIFTFEGDQVVAFRELFHHATARRVFAGLGPDSTAEGTIAALEAGARGDEERE